MKFHLKRPGPWQNYKFESPDTVLQAEKLSFAQNHGLASKGIPFIAKAYNFVQKCTSLFYISLAESSNAHSYLAELETSLA